MGTTTGLRCELQGNENEQRIYFSIEHPSALHFLIFSDEDGTKIYNQSNPAGYESQTFTAFLLEPIGPSTTPVVYHIRSREKAWDETGPLTYTLKKGEVLTRDINFCSGSWQISPKLPDGQPVLLRMKGRFEIQKDQNALKDGVWAGRIESNPIEVYLAENCVERLNSER